jgi:methionyl aminopeptidase
MIVLKNSEQIDLMRLAGRITGEALAKAGEAVRPGISTKHLDDIIRRHIESSGARPSFLGYGGFPASACISVNDEVIHGIPAADRILEEGDIVKIDVGACIKGYNGDSANTFPVGRISAEAQSLIDTTRASFYEGLKAAEAEGARLGDVGHAIEACVKAKGYSVVRMFVGHGVGRALHEQPDVPNYGTPGRGFRLCRGLTIAIEPMVNMGSSAVYVTDNKWTVRTEDGSLSAHYEHTVAFTENGIVLLTKI